ncbi:MAG TPA: DUF2076 domain-containing protein [Bradyrhizobium sp.]|nr:DUF2076 domain-containing protein [Bradyrhizobium sp.]
MTPQERQLVDELFGRLSKMENTPRDPEAAAAIAQGLRMAPNAIYPLVQTVLVQDEALRRANHRIQELESQSTPQASGGGFLDTMRGALLGQNQPQSSVPNVRPPDVGNRPVWNSGQVMQPLFSGQSGSAYSQAYGGPQGPVGGGIGGSFLGTAAAAAAGMVGGSLLLNGIRSMMGGSHYGFGDTGATTDHSTSQNPQNPWADQSASGLAHDAGIDDIGSSQDGTGTYSHDGLFDSASNGDDRDDMDMDSDDFGGGDSDSA